MVTSLNKKIPFILLVVFSLLVLLFFFNKGFIYHDEGHVLHAAQRMIDGEIIYRDFHFLYTPGSVFLTAFAFRIFGESILTGRVLMLLSAILSAILVFKIILKTTKNNLLGASAVGVYLAWGPTHINFPWPVMFSISSSLLLYSLFIKALKEKKNIHFLLIGILTAVTLLIKQNLGAAVFLTNIFIFMFIKTLRRKKQVVHYTVGLFATLLLFAGYLITTDSLLPFLNDFYQFSVKKIILEKTLNTPFVYGQNLSEKISKTLFYLSPLAISALGLFMSFTNKINRGKYFFLSGFVLLFYLFGIRPTTDYVHISPLLSLVGLPLAMIINELNKRYTKLMFSALTLALIFLGFHTALCKGYYRWETPLVKQRLYINHPRINIWTDEKYKSVVGKLLPQITKQTDRDDYIFIYPNAPMFYFISDRKNPTMYSDLSPSMILTGDQTSILKSLEKNNVKVILTHSLLKPSLKIEKYILENFSSVDSIYEFTLWEKLQ